MCSSCCAFDKSQIWSVNTLVNLVYSDFWVNCTHHCCWKRFILCLVSCFLYFVEAQLIFSYTADVNFTSCLCIETCCCWHCTDVCCKREFIHGGRWPAHRVLSCTMWRHRCCNVPYLGHWVQAANTLQLCDATEPRCSAAWITACLVWKPVFSSSSFF